MKQRGLAPILIVLILAALVGGYLIYQNQNQPKTVTNPQGYSGPPPEKVTVLKSNDNCIDDKKLCNLLADITKNVQKGDYTPLMEHQDSVEVTCVTGAPSSAYVCQGVKDGEKRNGYLVGSAYSEFHTLTRSQYIQKMNEYFKSNAPLVFDEIVIGTNHASAVYFSKTTNIFFVFDLMENGNEWKIKDIVLTDNKSYLKTYYPALK